MSRYPFRCPRCGGSEWDVVRGSLILSPMCQYYVWRCTGCGYELWVEPR